MNINLINTDTIKWTDEENNLKGDVDKNFIGGKTLWTNSSPTSDFATQTITLSESINNFKSYQIAFKFFKGDTHLLSVTLPVKYNCKLLGAFEIIAERRATFSGNLVTFNEAQKLPSYGQNTPAVDNTRCIPIEIIGFGG